MSTIVITPVAPRRVVRPAAQTTRAPRAVDAGGLRLTRRGRAVVVALGLALLLAAAVFLGAGSVASEQPLRTHTVTVAPGDTLWALAAESGADDVRDTMATIRDLNDLDSSVLQVGQTLRVPTR